MIDLRSDAVSRPSQAMLNEMMKARVGDDVFHDDPSILELEELAATMLGKEAALFCPSGIMCNQVAIKIQTAPGTSFLCNEFSHVYYHEAGGPAYLAGATAYLIAHHNGLMSAKDVESALSGSNNISLVTLENTVNKGGGCCYSFKQMKEIAEVCRKHSVNIHLDGARIFNAITATGDDIREMASLFDTVSFCLSKGLGAPAGSILTGTTAFMEKARATRNKFGGGMRQAGFLGAAGIFALKNNMDRLAEDHLHAQQIADTLRQCNYVEMIFPTETNIVLFRLREALSVQAFLEYLLKNKVSALQFGTQQVRMVTHLDISDFDIQNVCSTLKSFQA